MSGYPGGSGESNGLDSLFAQLRQQQNKQPVNLEPSYGYYNNNGYYGQPAQSQQLPPAYQQPSVSSALPTPPAQGLQPRHGSAVISPVETPQPRIPPATGGTSSADRTSSLLNLLKFSQPSASSTNQSSQPAPIGTPLPPSREPSISLSSSEVLGHLSSSGSGRGSSDLLAALMGSAQSKPAQQISTQLATASPPAPTSFSAAAKTSPSADTQAYLLQLLNQPKPPQTDTNALIKPARILTPPSKSSSPGDGNERTNALEEGLQDMSLVSRSETEGRFESAFGKENVRESTPKSNQGLFTYVNPFDQLAASSPRNRTPKDATPVPSSSQTPAFQILKNPRNGSGESADHKANLDDRSATSSQARSKRTFDQPSRTSSAPPTPVPDDRAPLEALIGIGGSSNKETVADALSEVGNQADKQAQAALARAEQEESQAAIEQDLRDMLAAKTEKEFEGKAKVAAKSIKKELEKDENSAALDSLPPPVAEAVKDIIDDAAQGHIADSWESADADDSPTKDETQDVVKVYNFPMRPWVSITFKETDEQLPVFRDEVIMDIARLKKEFDQIDRTLVTASNNFIVYGMSKNGGFRIIRQDDGKDARLFTETHDRIFSVATSSAPDDLKETIIGTGISGTVYWAVIKDGEGDFIEDNHPEMHGFSLPPIQSMDSESLGGVLKTRARKSSAHPDFFAVGRGKFIHIIWPSVIMKQSYLKNGKDRVVDTERYLRQHSLKVNTGKAGKDFTFSEDDTTIVSLDKAGRVKFWDVRVLTKTDSLGNPSPEASEPVEIKDPILTYTTTPATEKSWPTSVLFVDKLRPYQRGGPLRYMIVGMKQNHTLQLWDLALGKTVQEIHLPHGKESDAVCSVLYHAATGMIVVGHPTRNSIYFLHLSAPKYNLAKNVTQAEYMQKLVANDTSIPKPESTAVISGMREYSFANKGMLRSLDILQTPNSASTLGDSSTLFELYAMHSKGVTCLAIKQIDLGWTLDNKVIRPLAADKAGLITIDSLKEIPAPLTQEATDPATQIPVPTRIVSRPAAKETGAKEAVKKVVADPTLTAATPPMKPDETSEKKESFLSYGVPAASSGVEKTEKKKRKKAASSSETPGSTSASVPPTIQSSKSVAVDTPTAIAKNGSTSKASITAASDAAGMSGFAQDTSDAALKKTDGRIAVEVKRLFSDSLDSLYQNIKDDRRTQAAVADAKQDAMLRLVSSTLSDNIEATLGRIVTASIQKSVLPAISDVSQKAVNEQLGAKLNTQLNHHLPRELQKILPDVIGKALQQPQLLKLMSEALAKSVAFQVEEQFAVILQKVVTPAFSTLAVQASQRVAADIQRQAAEQIGTIERQRHADSMKIEQLTQLVTGLTETVSSMAAAQTEFQGQFLRMQHQAAIDKRQGSRQGEAGTAHSTNSRPSTTIPAAVEKTSEQIEYDAMLDGITQAMSSGNYNSAVTQWLQTRREQEFYIKFFSKYSPEFLRELSPLLLLSLGATISLDMDGELMMQRIAWLETLISAFQVQLSAGIVEEQVAEHIPRIVGIFIQRLEHLFMRISNISAQDPTLKRISLMVTAANRILETSR